MPYCPKCKWEFKEGAKICSDCGSELVNTLPPPPKKESIFQRIAKRGLPYFILGKRDKDKMESFSKPIIDKIGY